MPRSLHSRRLVAEALDILGGLPRAGLSCVPGQMPPRADAALSPDQLKLAERLILALTGWRAVVLAAPVGSGKTWVALHAAARQGGAIAVIGPASLRHQWLETAARLACDITYTSLARVSLGHLPPAESRIVLIDEAHRLRNPGTHRVRHLTPWLIGRETIYITGTPIVNGPRDLIRLLRLSLADDCLRLDGVASLEALVASPIPPRALERLVVRGAPPASRVPIVRRELHPLPLENARGAMVLETLGRLTLGESAAIGRLARVVLLDAAASSDAAWRLALERYRTLLRHAHQAGRLSRAAIRAFIGSCPDQGVMWELFRTSDLPSLLPVDDLTALDEALAKPSDDTAWITAVMDAIVDSGPTLLFTRHLGTLGVVRKTLGPSVAWVSGESAGIGEHRLPRRDVLAAFGPSRDAWRFRRTAPELLVLSDVGSEGLDLQGAQCVVHLDLPWHDTGIRQRTGRAARIGQRAPHVLEIRRLPPTPIGEALGIVRTVRRKARRARRWMRALDGKPLVIARSVDAEPASCDVVVIVIIQCGARQGAIALGRERGGASWLGLDLTTVEVLQKRGALVKTVHPPCPPPQLIEAIRRTTAPVFVSRPELVANLMAAATDAAERRQVDRVGALDDLVRSASRSHGIGLEQCLAGATLDELLRAAALFEREDTEQLFSHAYLIPAMT